MQAGNKLNTAIRRYGNDMMSQKRDSLRAGDRIPVGGEIFCPPVQTGSGAHLASCMYNAYRFIPGDKAVGAWR